METADGGAGSDEGESDYWRFLAGSSDSSIGLQGVHDHSSRTSTDIIDSPPATWIRFIPSSSDQQNRRPEYSFRKHSHVYISLPSETLTSGHQRMIAATGGQPPSANANSYPPPPPPHVQPPFPPQGGPIHTPQPTIPSSMGPPANPPNIYNQPPPQAMYQQPPYYRQPPAPQPTPPQPPQAQATPDVDPAQRVRYLL